MKRIELYAEMADYIFDYCGKYFWPNEIKAHKHLEAVARSNYGTNTTMYKLLQHMDRVSTDEDVLRLAEDGFDAYKKRVVERIFREHYNELDLNLCPRCGKIGKNSMGKAM